MISSHTCGNSILFLGSHSSRPSQLLAPDAIFLSLATLRPYALRGDVSCLLWVRRPPSNIASSGGLPVAASKQTSDECYEQVSKSVSNEFLCLYWCLRRYLSQHFGLFVLLGANLERRCLYQHFRHVKTQVIAQVKTQFNTQASTQVNLSVCVSRWRGLLQPLMPMNPNAL